MNGVQIGIKMVRFGLKKKMKEINMAETERGKPRAPRRTDTQVIFGLR